MVGFSDSIGCEEIGSQESGVGEGIGCDEIGFDERPDILVKELV